MQKILDYYRRHSQHGLYDAKKIISPDEETFNSKLHGPNPLQHIVPPNANACTQYWESIAKFLLKKFRF
jgi:hypothetical protein